MNTPTPTNTVVSPRVKSVIADMHSTLSVWYMYFVALAVSLKAGWTEFSTFIPPKFQHIGLGVVTFMALAEKIRRSVQNTTPDPVPPSLP